MSGSWDDFGNSKRMLKASLNSEDLSLLLDSLESSRAASPSLSRALRLSPGPSPVPGRFLSSSPAIQRKLSQSLSSLLCLSHGSTSSTPAMAPLSCADSCPRKDASAAAIPTLSITPPVPAEPPSADALGSHPMAVSMAASTNRFPSQAPPAPALTNSSVSVTVEQSGLVPAAINANNQPMEYAMMQPPAAQQFVPQNELGYYAEQVVLPPTAPPSGFVPMPMPADGETYNFTYKSDPTHMHTGAPQGWNCKCMPKDFRAEPMTTGNCKASGNYAVCPKNFVVSDTSSTKSRPHKQGGVKTYHCTVEDCDKTFITRKEQQNHIARHSAEPRYYCDYQGCTCKYTTKSSLDLHVTRIHAEKRFQCDLCEERYSVKGDLNQHMKRKHSKARRS